MLMSSKQVQASIDLHTLLKRKKNKKQSSGSGGKISNDSVSAQLTGAISLYESNNLSHLTPHMHVTARGQTQSNKNHSPDVLQKPRKNNN